MKRGLKLAKRKKKEGISLWQYMKPYKFLILVYILLVVALNVLTFFITLKSADALSHIGDQRWDLALKSILFLGLWAIVKNIVNWLMGVCNCYIVQRISRSIKLDLTDRIYKISSSTYANTDTGTFVQRVVNDPDRLLTCMDGIVNFILQLFSTVAVVVYLMLLNLWVGMVVFGGIVALTVIEMIRAKLFRKNQKKLMEIGDGVYSLTSEVVKSERDVKSLNLEKNLLEISKNKYEEELKANMKFSLTNGSLSSTRAIIATLIVTAMLAVAILLAKDFQIAVSTVMFVFMYRMNVTGLASIWGSLMQSISSYKVVSSRIASLYDEEKFPIEKYGDKMLEVCTGKIEVKNLTFSYNDHKDNKIVLDDISLKIEKNTTVAFVGKSGSGKTTLLNLIAKMLTTDRGEILIDDVNINDLNKESVRNHISLVNQFPYIFNMSIKDNLLMVKKDATDEELYSVLERACLLDFVKELPNGIDTLVGESGIKLSGGQRQRLAIARALIKNSSIILFDESTSSLDNLAQEHVRESIDALSGKKTVVIVAHRLSTIKNANKIYFIDEGKIVDEGTFEELFENNEAFKTMFLAENL